ncbi:MAG: zf-HC2 domain-containing protein [candidate division KSB1 bacterium]|nr:zf-HC2 domain-containing protein [candidate division KSB1 bacterium]MDZ7313967.1 zf-HC2 domain-containing protein [candidate division KSB1 bacterium]
MNCSEIQEYLLDYLDNELSASLQQVVAEHLQTCMVCREEIESYRKTTVLLQLRAVPEPPAAYWDETWEKIRAGFKARVLPLRRKSSMAVSSRLWPKRVNPRRALAVAAMFLLLVIAGWWSWQTRFRQLAEIPAPVQYSKPITRSVMPPEQELPEEVRRQIELINASRVAFGAIDPVSKSRLLARMEVNAP